MTTTTMHFGPEWMRTKQATPARTTAPSPPLAAPQITTTTSTTSSSYSALVASPSSQPVQEKHDLSRPFRFSKDDLLRIYKEGGGRGGLGLEVERWEGIVREVGSDPVGLKEMSEGEKKIFAGQLNSEVRRRQSTDYLSPLSTERPKLSHLNSGGPGSPMRERMGNFAGRRRDSTDQPPLTLPRKQSLSSMQAPLQSPRDVPLPSPRTRIGASGFDGGVLDGSWTSKRRAAEAAAKAGGKVDRQPEKSGVDEKLKSEEKEMSLAGDVGNGTTDQPSLPAPQTIAINGSGEGTPDPATVSTTASVSSTTASPTTTLSGPPPGLDLASLEWSYLDPQGQVQGPFRADVMQKWFDEGYFTPELLMKRTHLETEWTPVRVLQQIAVSTPVFLTPIASPRPPEPQPQPQQVDFATLNGIRYDTEVQRPLTTTLNARLHDGSNPSDSPLSSYSNPHFSNSSPDPSTFGSRAVNGGGMNDVSNSYASLNSVDVQRQSPAHDPMMTRPYTGHQAPVSVGGNGFIDSYNMNGYSGAANLNGSLGGSMDLHAGGLNGYQHSPSEYSEMANTPLAYNMSQSETSAALAGLRLDPRELQPRYVSSFASGGGSPFSGGPGYSPLSPSSFMGQQDIRNLQQPPSPFPPRRASGSTHMPLQQNMSQPFLPQSSIPAQASRVAQDSLGFRRPGPFDVNYPTSQNTIVQQRTVTPSQASSYGSQSLQNGNVQAEPSWYASSKGVVPEGWNVEPSNLTVANLGHHNQLLNERESEKPLVQSAEPEPVPEPADADSSPQRAPAVAVQSSSLQPSPSAPAEPNRPKPRRKPSAPPAKPAVPVEPLAAPIKPPTPSQSEPKQPAWNVDDEKNSSGAVMSLREIQEVEAKKAETRKAAERERVAARVAVTAAATIPPVTEPVQTFTASWGLPTSQAGSVRAVASASKESSTSPSLNSTPIIQSPVWTTTTKPVAVKKTMTMKEIQEEEERRKKLAAKEKETMAAAARRGYADTTTKTSTAVSSGGAWTTVGSGGKTSVAAAAVASTSVTPVRPPVLTSASSKGILPATAPVPIRSTSTGNIAQRTAASIAATKTPIKVEESPAPSADFLKWLGDTLKGLNSSVNLEEIASMLLQFPVDPDPSTVEIISDLIYTNSTTLDGRRFAAEFVNRRKASTKASPATGTSGKLSIADIVKTQPKPAQNEWSGFKVVNKKKKGSRA